jgi:drug/metabolite transporter (DMT)-like permease
MPEASTGQQSGASFKGPAWYGSVMSPLDTFSLASFTLMLSCGQVMFKRVGLSLQGHSGLEAMVQVLREPSLYLALALYGFATMLWIWILSRVTLVQAYPWVAVGMVIVPLLGWFVFGERVTPAFWLGVAFIVVGVGLTQYGAARPHMTDAVLAIETIENPAR